MSKFTDDLAREANRLEAEVEQLNEWGDHLTSRLADARAERDAAQTALGLASEEVRELRVVKAAHDANVKAHDELRELRAEEDKLREEVNYQAERANRNDKERTELRAEVARLRQELDECQR